MRLSPSGKYCYWLSDIFCCWAPSTISFFIFFILNFSQFVVFLADHIHFIYLGYTYASGLCLYLSFFVNGVCRLFSLSVVLLPFNDFQEEQVKKCCHREMFSQWRFLICIYWVPNVLIFHFNISKESKKTYIGRWDNKEHTDRAYSGSIIFNGQFTLHQKTFQRIHTNFLWVK